MLREWTLPRCGGTGLAGGSAGPGAGGASTNDRIGRGFHVATSRGRFVVRAPLSVSFRPPGWLGRQDQGVEPSAVLSGQELDRHRTLGQFEGGVFAGLVDLL